MPAKKTNFIPFACFGYFDKTFEECEKCKHKEPCNNATNSEEYQEIRKIYKYKTAQINELVKKWKSKK